eukprot:m.13777 g.13777  ORF g.13777 m.13777 type:complete len:221 (+) comp20605_c0_seq1:124-786(+)
MSFFDPARQYFCIDVECVATGTGHNDRDVAQIALVDSSLRVLLNLYVRPVKPVVSYITALTGITAEMLAGGVPLDQAIAMVKRALPKDAILTGQNIAADIRWLGLQEGVDFGGLVDLSGVFRAFNTKFNSWSYFSLRHEITVLLGAPPVGSHNAVMDSVQSMQLFHRAVELSRAPAEMERAKQMLLAAPVEQAFNKRFPHYEGVCMGNRKSCTCGSPFLY